MKRMVSIAMCAVLALSLFASCVKPAQPLTVTELLDLGEKYLLELDYDQALVQFLNVIEIDPMNPRGYTGAADAYIGLGQPDNAIAVLQDGLEALPGNEDIQTKLDDLQPPEVSEAPEQSTEPQISEEPPDEPMPPSPETTADADYIVQWKDPEFERMVRIGLSKPEGDIWRSELDRINKLEILGGTHCFINNPGSNWGFMFSEEYKLGAFYGIFDDSKSYDSVEKYNQKGNIQDISDVLNFKNLTFLTIIANHISDLSPLVEMENQLEGRCNFFANDISDTNLLDLFSSRRQDGSNISVPQFIEIGGDISAYIPPAPQPQ